MDYLPRGDMVDDAAWQRRHRFLVGVLVSLAPLLLVFGLAVGNTFLLAGLVALVPLLTAAGGWFVPGRLAGEIFVSAGLSASCGGLVILSGGYIEAHFSFFVIIGFLMLYQHWVPFAVNIVFTTLSHGLGTLLVPTLFFNHHAAQHSPWLWSAIHGFAVLLACAGVAIFVKITQDEQRRRIELGKELHESTVRQQEFTSELLLNLARRNQSMFHRQLDIINDLEERERDPDALADLFRLDHLATRVRRNAESLLVLSGEQPARVWSAPVALRDVVRAGVAETEDLDRVTLAVDERPRLVGSTVADLTHMIAELVENAARYSPPSAPVVLQSRPYHRTPGAHLLVIEDTGIGMPPAGLAAANELLAHPQETDVSAAARRLGFHVVARLAERHGIGVSLTPTPGCGLTAVLLLPAALFAESAPTVPAVGDRGLEQVPASAVPVPRRGSADAGHAASRGNGSGPASGPVPVNGRHAWPGRVAPDHTDTPDTPDAPAARAERRRAAHAAPAGDDEAAPADAPVEPAGAAAADGADPHATLEDTPPAGTPEGAPAPARRGLIHPIVVPPPAPVPDGEAGPAAPAPRRPDGDAPAPAGPHGLVLARRRPQSHLAPELIRRTPSIPAATPVTAARTGPEAGAPPRGREDGREDGRPDAPSGDGAVSALSAYQASRAAARSAMAEENDDHPQRGSTSGRQT
ncbi:ATP-binding protein [Actinomycetospora lutea]|uniref:ATP-binding protein n=1 Tax=Actinomycetospora lutea TaxID=663604 RepID=UPI00236594C7|nr:ATP-binding protein [Actinomycetospora lutea]MDD7937234.1 ATP-binding protein [Actinomycetospora lutea]